ncbi:hypothetical protein C2E19_28065 [Pseudomonas sp. DTU12.3]|nr:hypothetical protein C2E19_28065 [Pseudomonas sp. DTU12.3]
MGAGLLAKRPSAFHRTPNPTPHSTRYTPALFSGATSCPCQACASKPMPTVACATATCGSTATKSM